MPISSNEELAECKKRVLAMFMDTISTFKAISEESDNLFGETAHDIDLAINEYLEDFITDTKKSGERHPQIAIFDASLESFQSAGFYGAQLDLKERQVFEANGKLRDWLKRRIGGATKKIFRDWIDIINNFLGSLSSATGMGEALKELKDCLRDELPENKD